MHALSTTAMAVLGVIMALWLVGAAWAIYSGFAMRRRSAFTAEQADRLTTLLESAPALPVVVRADGRIDAPDRLAGWLGLEKVPKFISQLVRSEEHTSELQSLMRISYAVFCLKKKTPNDRMT